MPAQPFEPFKVVTVLRDRHIKDLGPREFQVLSGIELGCWTKEIADYLGVPDASIRREVSALQALVFDSLPLEPSRCALAKWTRDHFGCCTSACVDLVMNNEMGRARLELYRGLCHPGLSPRQLQVVAAVELGYPVSQIAEGLQLAESTVKGHIARLGREIFGGVLIAGHTHLAKWTHEQLGCCTRGCVTLFQKNGIFSPGDHTGRATSA